MTEVPLRIYGSMTLGTLSNEIGFEGAENKVLELMSKA